MHTVPVEAGLILAAALFVLGVAGLVVRRNVLFMLMSLEIMLNATGLAFVAAGARWADPQGQAMFILILTLAAAEVSVGLALIVQMYQRLKTVDVDEASRMGG